MCRSDQLWVYIEYSVLCMYSICTSMHVYSGERERERESMCVYEYKVQDRSFIGQVRKYMYFVLRVKIVGS